MTLAQAAGYAVHVVVGALWTGSVLFVALGIVPAALRGDVSVELFEYVLGRLRTVSRLSAVVLLATGAWQASFLYTAETLTGTPRGHLVLTMTLLWLVLAAVVEVGVARAREGLAERKIRTPAAEARPFLYAGAVVATLILLDAGLLAADVRLGLF